MPIVAIRRPLAPPGDEPYCRFTWKGPSSYSRVGTTPVAAGSTVSNGDPLSASTLGMNVMTVIDPAVTYSGNYLVLGIRVDDSKWILKWIALVSGSSNGQSQTAYTEAAASSDLSTETVKLVAHAITG